MFKQPLQTVLMCLLTFGTFYAEDSKAWFTKKMSARQEARKDGKAAQKQCREEGGSKKECRAVKRSTKQASKAKSGAFNAIKSARLQARADGNLAKADCIKAGKKGCGKLKRAVKAESKARSGVFGAAKTERLLKRADRRYDRFDRANGNYDSPMEYAGQLDNVSAVEAPSVSAVPVACGAGTIMGVNGQCVQTRAIVIEQAPAVLPNSGLPLGVASGRSIGPKRVGPQYNLDLGQQQESRDVNASNNPYVQTYRQISSQNSNQGNPVQGSLGK